MSALQREKRLKLEGDCHSECFSATSVEEATGTHRGWPKVFELACVQFAMLCVFRCAQFDFELCISGSLAPNVLTPNMDESQMEVNR